jgi:hypothetical protein
MPEFVQPLSNAEADENSPIELLAHIKGNPTPKIEWSHGGSILRNGPNYEVISYLIGQNKANFKNDYFKKDNKQSWRQYT